MKVGPKLQRGDVSPLFKVISSDGKFVDLNAYTGRKVWLIFYRYAACPLCCLHLSELKPHLKVLRELGVEIITVFETASPSLTAQICGTEAVPFPIIGDAKKELYGLYGVGRSIAALFRPSVARDW